MKTYIYLYGIYDENMKTYGMGNSLCMKNGMNFNMKFVTENDYQFGKILILLLLSLYSLKLSSILSLLSLKLSLLSLLSLKLSSILSLLSLKLSLLSLYSLKLSSILSLLSNYY